MAGMGNKIEIEPSVEYEIAISRQKACERYPNTGHPSCPCPLCKYGDKNCRLEAILLNYAQTIFAVRIIFGADHFSVWILKKCTILLRRAQNSCLPWCVYKSLWELLLSHTENAVRAVIIIQFIITPDWAHAKTFPHEKMRGKKTGTKLWCPTLSLLLHTCLSMRGFF